MSFFETSAKDGENVAEALLTIARSISHWLIVEGVKDRNWTDDSKHILDDVRNDQVYELSVTGELLLSRAYRAHQLVTDKLRRARY